MSRSATTRAAHRSTTRGCSPSSARTGQRGRPLTDYETIENYIGTTRTKTGLRVDAHLVRAEYTAGVKISDKEMKHLSIRHHDIQPNRN
ncbi:MAG: hypothetical protein M0Z95_14720 [Actinomycetota bacterium]|nr:hypothetical protein [Actinomycetota bacterium]